jgi:DNA mismatch repair ATPase MutL
MPSRRLDPLTIDRIVAGEVIERGTPAQAARKPPSAHRTWPIT